MTLKEALKRSRGVGPGFHMLRHALSLTILFHHCRVMVVGSVANQTYEKGLLTAELTYGQVAVELLRPGLFALIGIFFALSGFLIAGSAVRNPDIRIFFANRALRILPALSVEVTLSALILGPAVTTVALSEYFTHQDFFRYFGNIVGLVSFTLPGVFESNPWPDVVNGNLWTLPPEFWCYFFMLLLMVGGLLLRPRVLTALIICCLIISTLLNMYDPSSFVVKANPTHFANWYIVMLFFFGIAFYLNAKHVILHPLLFVASGIAYYLLTMMSHLGPLSGVFLTYCMVYVGTKPFPIFDKFVKVDLSYGIYLYGWPITQTVIFFTLPLLVGQGNLTKVAIIFPVVLILTCAFAAASWNWIEKPALSLRKVLLRTPSSAVRSRSV